MNSTKGSNVLDLTSGAGPPRSRAGSVVHVYGTRAPSAADSQVAQIARLISDGWAACVVLPIAPAWDGVADAMTRAGVRVVRTRSGSTRAPGLAMRVARLTRRRARWLMANGFDVIHAHDDRAGTEWGTAARRNRTPLVLDVDLRVPRSLIDVLPVACASLVIACGSGPRLRSRRVLPPIRAVAGDRDGDWYDLVEDPQGGPAMVNVATVADVYLMLTGAHPGLRSTDVPGRPHHAPSR